MRTAIRKLATGSKNLIILHRIYDNWLRKRAFEAGNTVSSYGSTHVSWTINESVRYIEKVYDDYLEYSGLTSEAFRGKNILEVGPGDNFGVALKFLAAAAERVVCLDKFYSERESDQEIRIYRALRETLAPEERSAFDKCIKLEGGVQLNPNKIEYIFGYGIEDAADVLPANSFDFIISRAVLHNVYNMDRGFDVMHRLLVPGGYMFHKIDLSDENMFSSRGMHPLTFLTISEGVYRLMAADSGKPNRKLINYYRQKMLEYSLNGKIFVTSILGQGPLIPHKEFVSPGVDYSDMQTKLIGKIRPKLTDTFRPLPDSDLIPTGIFLIAQKPPHQRS